MAQGHQVFLVAVLLTPTAKEIEEHSAAPKLVVEPQGVVAKDEQSAALKAGKLVPKEYEGMEDRLEVQVVPFRSVGR